ncbi:MAG: hypothetical protein APF77_14610 [Clostridia bacterium BRH_c25]|nr:MAG: hypothetical protein APF77_14610 [Clostridia bacterium BRH_c25]
MKKLVALTLAGMIMIATSVSVFADNAVSVMATEKGGKAVAACAKEMDKGVSECARMTECNE